MLEEARERWPGRASFILAAVGSAVGLGNAWRFPYVCYANGGGAFLIPYFIGLFVLGIPWLAMELGMGHMMQKGAPQTFASMGKKWEWAGWWQVLMAFMLVIYYVVIMSWCLGYMVHSATLSWGSDATGFFHDFIGKTGGVEVTGALQWPILIGLLICWVAIFFILHRGVRRVGKVVWFTVLLPWALLVILVIRGLTLDGALDGLNWYLEPNLAALLKPNVWVAAFGQIAFSLSVGQGVMIAYASYLPKKSDVTNNCVITSLADAATAFFAGFAVFSILGFMIFQNPGLEIGELSESSIGLAFTTYPTAISQMPTGGQIIGIIFFLCLWTLGIDSAFSLAESFITAITDKWEISKDRATALVCSFAFLAGAIFTTGAGIYWLDIVDHAVGFYGLLLCGLTMCLVVGWVFGADKLRCHLNEASDIKLGKWFNWFIKVVTPLAIMIPLVPALINNIRTPYNGHPQWALLIGLWGALVGTLVLAFVLAHIKEKEEAAK